MQVTPYMRNLFKDITLFCYFFITIGESTTLTIRCFSLALGEISQLHSHEPHFSFKLLTVESESRQTYIQRNKIMNLSDIKYI